MTRELMIVSTVMAMFGFGYVMSMESQLADMISFTNILPSAENPEFTAKFVKVN